MNLLQPKNLPTLPASKVKSIFSTNVTLQWNKNTSASGYEIEQYKSGKWVNVAKITGNATTSYTVKGLAAGTAGYQFRIRAYRTEGKNKVYSGYSSVVKVKHQSLRCWRIQVFVKDKYICDIKSGTRVRLQAATSYSSTRTVSG